MTFGLHSTDLDNMAQTLERALNVKFVGHESSFRGGDYYRAETELIEIILQRNFDSMESEAFESAWPSEKLILYVETPESDPAADLVKSIQNVIHGLDAVGIE